MWMNGRLSWGRTDEPPEPLTPDELRDDIGPAAQLCTEGVVGGCIHLIGLCTERACTDRREVFVRAGIDPAPLTAAWQVIDLRVPAVTSIRAMRRPPAAEGRAVRRR